MLQVEQELVQLQIGRLFQQGELELHKAANDEFFIWSKVLFVCEQGIISEIERLRRHPTLLRKIGAKAIAWAEEKQTISFAAQQKEALIQALSKNFQSSQAAQELEKAQLQMPLSRFSVRSLQKFSSQLQLAVQQNGSMKSLAILPLHYIEY